MDFYLAYTFTIQTPYCYIFIGIVVTLYSTTQNRQYKYIIINPFVYTLVNISLGYCYTKSAMHPDHTQKSNTPFSHTHHQVTTVSGEFALEFLKNLSYFWSIPLLKIMNLFSSKRLSQHSYRTGCISVYILYCGVMDFLFFFCPFSFFSVTLPHLFLLRTLLFSL